MINHFLTHIDAPSRRIWFFLQCFHIAKNSCCVWASVFFVWHHLLAVNSYFFHTFLFKSDLRKLNHSWVQDFIAKFPYREVSLQSDWFQTSKTSFFLWHYIHRIWSSSLICIHGLHQHVKFLNLKLTTHPDSLHQ